MPRRTPEETLAQQVLMFIVQLIVRDPSMTKANIVMVSFYRGESGNKEVSIH